MDLNFWGIPIKTRKHRFEDFIHAILLNSKSIKEHYDSIMNMYEGKAYWLKINVIAHA